MSEWIKCSDRMPTTHIKVLVYHKAWGIEVQYKLKIGSLLIGLMGDKATHWMPLPKPPEVNEK